MPLARVYPARYSVLVAGKKIPTRLRDLILARDGGLVCVYCLRPGTLEVDHVLCEADNGPTEPWNLVTSCEWCNNKKGQIDLDLFCIYLVRRGLGGGDARAIEKRVERQCAIVVAWPIIK
jgi:5-methylcytosine-specific restriction endonuclease McrA